MISYFKSLASKYLTDDNVRRAKFTLASIVRELADNYLRSQAVEVPFESRPTVHASEEGEGE